MPGSRRERDDPENRACEISLARLSPRLGIGAFGERSAEADTPIGQMADIASEVPERLGCCHGPTEAHSYVKTYKVAYRQPICFALTLKTPSLGLVLREAAHKAHPLSLLTGAI